MINAFTVQHYEHATDRSFEEVVAAFEAATGSVEKGELNAAIREAKSLSEFEAKVRSFEAESGFMRFMTADHARWLRHFGVKALRKGGPTNRGVLQRRPFDLWHGRCSLCDQSTEVHRVSDIKCSNLTTSRTGSF
jgi:hypothetical protein